jgi:hypothetical protein
MDDAETLHRRARLRELVKHAFGDTDAALLAHIERRTGKKANQGEISTLQKDHSGRSFGDKKARTLTLQVGLPRDWFSLPLGTALHPDDWKQHSTASQHAAEASPAWPPGSKRISLTEAIETIAKTLADADHGTRELAAGMLGNLARSPENHTRVSVGLLAILGNGGPQYETKHIAASPQSS